MQLGRMGLAVALSLALAGSACAQQFRLKVIAFNDFHGNLESPGNMRANSASPAVRVGGIDYLAGYVAQLRSEDPDNIVVSAGDLTGASPLISSLFHHEDTIETMNRLGLEINAVGNHEFDGGTQELFRLQKGGCSTLDENSCEGRTTGTPYPFQGAKFQYLAANVFNVATGKTIFPAYEIKTWHGVKVAFIGLTLKETPTIVIPSEVAGLRFADEADTINDLVRQLHSQGVQSFVVLIHQGGGQKTVGPDDINACVGDLQGSEIREIVGKLDDPVDLVLSAHTHRAYVCSIPNAAGRKIVVTSASSYGRVVTSADLTIDIKTGKVAGVTARNILVDRTNPAIVPDTAIRGIVDRYKAMAAPIMNRVVGSVTADISKQANGAGESQMGDLIADAQLEATSRPGTGNAVAAFMNEGGVRARLPFASNVPGVAPGEVTFGELFTVQPFGNELVTMSLTGGQIKTLLEEQFRGCALGGPPGEAPPSDNRLLEVSKGFIYTVNLGAPPCHKVDPASIRIRGVPVSPAERYRITVNSLLADGGAQFYVLNEGTDRIAGPPDIDALAGYFARRSPVAPPEANRVAFGP